MRRSIKRTGPTDTVALALAALLATGPAAANEFLRSTHILGIYQGSTMSGIAEGLRNSPDYELQQGERVRVRDWYMNDWTDIVVDMLTEIDENTAFLWSFSTGERGEKYIIDPSIGLGLITQREISPTAVIAMTVNTVLFGNFTELPCQADFGAIGGVQDVNCRLAATPLPPEETLDFLVRAEPTRFRITFSLQGYF